MRKNSVKNTRIQRPKNRSDDFCCVCGSSSGFKDL